VLKKAGAPTTPDAAGIPDAFYRDAVLHARLIRDRYFDAVRGRLPAYSHWLTPISGGG